MPSIPAPVLHRLAASDQEALIRFLAIVDTTLRQVYREALLDHQESRGDDAQLFGFKVYKHERYALMQAVTDDAGINFAEDNGAYQMLVGPLRLRIDSLGHFAHEDVLAAFPDASPTKRAVGHRNDRQLRFELPDQPPRVGAYALNALTVGHFGNPREGLVKWYLGAWTQATNGTRSWAWIERQDDIGEEIAPLSTPEPIVPFHERPADAVSVQPRRSA